MPVAVVSGLAAAARRGILIKGGVSVEEARKLRAIALDKTATIAAGKLLVVTACAIKSVADKIPPMRRWLSILILVFLPFQFTWAAVASYCQHETGAAAQHFGHHDHQHQADADHGAAPDAKTLSGGIDGDCAACHAGCAAAIFGLVYLPAPSAGSFAIPWLAEALTAPPLAHPERPNWFALA